MSVVRDIRRGLDEALARFAAWADDVDRRSRTGEFGKWPWQRDYGLWPWQRRRHP